MTKVSKSVSFENSTITRIDEYKEKKGIGDFSAAVEDLVLKGLEK